MLQIYTFTQLYCLDFCHEEKDVMKNLALICIVLFTSLFLFSCNDEINHEQYVYEYGMKVNDVFQTKSNSLKFRIKEINDSRCPKDVVCVWAGMVEVKLDVETPEKKVLSLNSYNNLADTIGVYEIRLVEVQPYPVSTKVIKPEDYEVSLKITVL